MITLKKMTSDKLPLPKRVKEVWKLFQKKEAGFTNGQMKVADMEFTSGSFVERRFYFVRKNRRYKQDYLFEYARLSENRIRVTRNVVFYPSFGYQIQNINEPQDWAEIIDDFPFNMSYDRELYDINTIIQQDERLKYCAFDESVPALVWIDTYRKKPEIELLGKLGLGWIYFYRRIQKVKENEKKVLYRYLYEHAEELNAERHTLNINELFYKVFPEKYKKAIERKAKIDAEKERIEKEARQKEAEQMEALNPFVGKVVKAFAGLETCVGNYHFALPDSIEQIQNTGQKLSHCYQSGQGLKNYTKRHILGNSLLIFITDLNDKTIATLEYEIQQKKLIQARTKYNRDLDDEIQEIVNQYIQTIETKQIKFCPQKKKINSIIEQMI